MKKTAGNFGAVVVVLAALSGAMAASCDNGSGSPIPPPAPTVQDVTVPLTLFGESLYLVCLQSLLPGSQSKISGVLSIIEANLSGGPGETDFINLLSANNVTVIVKNDGSVASCEKSGPFTMTINYQWLQTSADTDIGDAMLPVFGQMVSGT